jgi:DNA-binding NarL/FixJ family response regulator
VRLHSRKRCSGKRAFETGTVSVCEDEEVVQEALALGVRGFVLKSRLASDLRLAAREVLAGRTFLSKPLDKIGKHIG